MPLITSTTPPPLTTIYTPVAKALATFVDRLSLEMSLESFASLESSVFTSLFSLVHSADQSCRLAGIFALTELITAASSDEEKKAIKFANNLSNGLRTSQDYPFLKAAAYALGRMSRGASNADYVEFELTRALEWLRTDRSDRRLAAALVLQVSEREKADTQYAPSP